MQAYFSRLVSQYAVLILLVLAAVLRIAWLGSVPFGMHADEASFLLNAQTILETGRDEDGQLLPLTLHSLIDPKPAIFSYLQLPFVLMFGANLFAARLPAAVLGVISVYLMYLLVQRVSGSKALALVSTALLAISPWHIMVSRATQEVILSFVFLQVAIITLLTELASKKTSWKRWGVFAVAAFLSMYVYHSSKVFLLLLVPSLVVIVQLQQRAPRVRALLTALKLPMLIIAGVLLLSLVVQESATRFSAVGVLSNPEPQLILEEQIRKATGETPGLLIRVFYNKVVWYGRAILQEYMQHFSAQFLFFAGGEPQRYFVPYHGLLYLLEIPLVAAGVLLAAVKKRTYLWPLIAWAVLAPLPAAATFIETPSVIRAFPLVLPLLVFVAETVLWCWRQPRLLRILSIAILVAGYTWSLAFFWQQYSVQQRLLEPWYRNTPYTDIAQTVSEIHEQYDQVLVTNDLRPLYAYFALEGALPYSELQDNPYARETDEYQVGKFVFNRGVCQLGELQTGVLYVAETECRVLMGYPSSLHVVETISYKDGLPVYELLEYRP